MGLLPDIADGVGVDIPSGGHLISAYALGVVVGAPVIAALGARLPRRGLLVGLMAAFLIGNALTAARPRLRDPPRRPLPQRPAARRVLRGRLAGRRLAGRARTCAAARSARCCSGWPPPCSPASPPRPGWVSNWAGGRRTGRSPCWPRSPSPRCSPSSRRRPAGPRPPILGELGALRRPQVILTLLVGIVGFGGMFALYSYIAPLSTEVAELSRGTVPLVLLVVRRRRHRRDGAGRPAGRLGPVPLPRRLARGALRPARPRRADLPWAPALFVGVFLVSIAASALAVLPADAADGDGGGGADARRLAQPLVAQPGQRAGRLARGLVIAAGLGYQAPAAVGAALAVAGLIPLAASAVVRRRTLRASAHVPAGQAAWCSATGCPPPDPVATLQRGCNVAAPRARAPEPPVASVNPGVPCFWRRNRGSVLHVLLR